jgi:FdhE protein
VTAGIDEKILRKLEKLEKSEGPLSGSLGFYGKILSIQSTARSHITTPRCGLSPEDISERITTGRPLLECTEISVDWSLFENIYKEISALISGYSKEWAESAVKTEANNVPLEKLARNWFEGDRSSLPGESDTAGALHDLVMRAAFKPFLVVHAEALVGFVDNELWRRGFCPVCGGSPDFAFLDKERGARWLLCSRCDTEWLFKRLECPYCGTQNQDDLAYFTDDKGLYRVYVCERCRHYLKTVDLRLTEDEVLIPLERLLTLDLDIQTQKNGYKPLAIVGGEPEPSEDS